MEHLTTTIINAGSIIVTSIAIGSFNDDGKRLNDLVFPKLAELFKIKNQSPNSFSPETGIDYSELERLLKKAKANDKEVYWIKANTETNRLMLLAVRRGQSDWIRKEEMRKFSISDLQIIDSLWLKYSDGKFGLSV